MCRRLACTLLVVAVSLGACAADEAEPTAAVSETVVDAGEVDLRVRTTGPPGAEEVVVAIHGGPGLSLEAMEPLGALARDDRRIVTYDQRGAGRSTSPASGDLGLDAHVADLEAVRRATGASSVHLVGQSWGGVVATAYASQHPDRVDSLALLGAMPLDVEAFLAGQEQFRRRLRALQEEGIVPRDLPADEQGSCLAAFRAVLPAYLADPRAAATDQGTTCTAATSRATYEAFVGSDRVAELGRDLGRYRGPALVVMGERDPFGLEWLRRNVELLDGADVDPLVVEETGHLLVAERPGPVLDALAAFLAAA